MTVIVYIFVTISVENDCFFNSSLLCGIQSVSYFFQFELTSVTQFAAHQENKRLVGFVVRMPESTGGESLSTYVFESNSEGEKVLLFFFNLRFYVSIQRKIFKRVFYTTSLDI